MRLPSFKRIYTQDFQPESQPTVDRLAGILNIGIEVLYDLANNKISLTDNVAAVVRDIVVSVNSSGTPLSSTSISLGSVVRTAIGASVILAQNQTNTSIYPIAQPFISFTQNGTSITIDNIAGIPANNQFLLRIVVWGA